MNILGISCYYHDAAACLIRDGKVAAAAQEERFNRIKHSSVFPVNAVNFCLQFCDITIRDIDYVVFYEKPFLKFSRVVIDHLRSWPFSLNNFLGTMPNWLSDRLILPITLKRDLGYRGKVLFVKHHMSHAASAFLVSPFDEAAVLTVDGIGEWATASYGTGRKNEILIRKEINYPDSLGLLYAAVTTHLGFKVLEGEGTVMALASFGKPSYIDKFRQIVRVMPDGSFAMDRRFFSFASGGRMYSKKFTELFGEARKPDSKLEERHCDIASSLQRFTEETLVTIARNVHRETGLANLCLAGGVFLNCVANSKILEETPFKNLFVQPAAGDAGGALGAAAFVYNSVLGKPRDYVMTDAYLGPEFPPARIRRLLVSRGMKFREFTVEELQKYIAEKISDGKIIGWFQGRMEFGPRALGNRSILANPCNPDMPGFLNTRVKKREPFRPYAPSVLEERASEFFEMEGKSPFMLLSPRVRADKKSVIPAVTHVDGTARVQTVGRDTNPVFWGLIKEFEKLTGVPVILNTSFNLRGEAIVCTPKDALDCFLRSGMDCLALGNFVVEKDVGK